MALKMNPRRPTVSRRIVVLGNIAAGKTTLTRELGKRLQIVPTELDEYGEKLGWEAYPLFAPIQEKLVSEEQWILDGIAFHQGLVDRVQAANTVIFLDYSPKRCTFQLLKRNWGIFRHNRNQLPGNNFFSQYFFMFCITIRLVFQIWRNHVVVRPQWHQLLSTPRDKQIFYWDHPVRVCLNEIVVENDWQETSWPMILAKRK